VASSRSAAIELHTRAARPRRQRYFAAEPDSRDPTRPTESFPLMSVPHPDPGQIALKTVGLAGACNVYAGLPFVRLDGPHGTARDSAGQGLARHQGMLSAAKTAALPATGRPLASD
jgi:hypothetical protein